MDTFQNQYARLSPSAQRKFCRLWGSAPWEDPAKNQPQQRRAWKEALDPPPSYPRWEQAACGKSPLWMALRAKNRRAASALLDQTAALSREEAGELALLTLQWAPDLLERLLALAPNRPYFWLRHEISLDRAKHLQLRLRGSLVMIAAALNDLSALEILLRRGDKPDYNFQRDRWGIIGDLLSGGITMGALHSPEYSLQQLELAMPFPDDSNRVLLHADPLSAAIFCNAKRCAARLLEEPSVTVTPAVRRALAILPENETQALVAQRLDVPPVELLQPEDFGPEPDHPLFLPVLRRNPTLPRKKVEELVKHYKHTSDPALHARHMELFSLIDPELLGDTVWEVWSSNNRRTELLELANRLSLPLDRCRVPDHCWRDTLLSVLENFLIVGQPPENGLSGLAAALLAQLNGNFRHQAMPAEQLLLLPGVEEILRGEHPAMLTAYLEKMEIPAQQTLPLLRLLGIQKEVAYDL